MDIQDELIREIRASNGRIEREKDLLNRLVLAARRQGVTWDEIGESLGITRQGAHLRFSPKIEELLRSA